MASVSAFAQSSVELYGGLDTGIVKQKSDTAAVSNASVTNRKYTGGNAGYTSRLGVRGSEDLGGGNKATFNWEAALGSLGADGTNNQAFSTSSQNSTRTAQVSWVSTANGTVTAGYGMNARHVMAATVSQNDYSLPGNLALAASSGGNGTTLAATGNALTNADYTLRSNSVSYTTPSMGGLQLVVGTVLANNSVEKADGTATANTNANAKVLGGIYNNGPLTLMGSYTRTTADGAVATTGTQACVKADGTLEAGVAKCSPGATLLGGTAAAVYNPSTRNNSIYGGLYQLGGVKVGFARYQDKLINDVTTSDNINNRGYLLSARGVVSGPFEAFALYTKGKYQKDATGLDRDQSGYQLAGFYNFSKRTAAYVATGTQKRDTADATKNGQAKDTATTIGLRHNF